MKNLENPKVNWYTCITEREIEGTRWLILTDGETIVVAKRWSLLRLHDDVYSLLYDSEGKTKVEVLKDADVVLIKAVKEVK